MNNTVPENLARMIQLVNDFFDTRNDPAQISVNQKQRKKLLSIHPDSMTQKSVKKGPVAWILIFPTTKKLMMKFINKEITERELLNRTPLYKKYDAIYLCSAIVLQEYRRKGIAKSLICKAVKSIKREHPIDALFYWAFSNAGRRLARSVANECRLPLYKRSDD